MKNMKYLALLPLAFILGCAQNETPSSDQNYDEDWESLAKANTVPEWFQDAKFGIYTHWGPASSAFAGAKEGVHLDGWHGMRMYENKGRRSWETGEAPADADGTNRENPTSNFVHHYEKYGDPAEFGYKYIIEQFNPSGFNAKQR